MRMGNGAKDMGDLKELKRAATEEEYDCVMGSCQEEMFQRFAEELTVCHTRLLAFFDDPKGCLKPGVMSELKKCGFVTAIKADQPHKQGFLHQVIRDLENRGLIFGGLRDFELGKKHTTELGEEFLEWLTGDGR